MFGQPLVHEGIIRVQQIDHAAVLMHDAAEEQFRSLFASPAAGCRRNRETARRRSQRLQSAQVQPLPGEVDDELVRARIGTACAALVARERRARAAYSGWRELISSSSGMLLHKKNDRREASSRSLMRHALPREAIRRLSFLCGKQIRGRRGCVASALSIPVSKFALVAALLIKTHQQLGILIGHRAPEGRRASVLTISCAHGCFLVDSAGWHTKIFRRLGESGAPAGFERAKDLQLADMRKELESRKTAGLDRAAQKVLIKIATRR